MMRLAIQLALAAAAVAAPQQDAASRGIVPEELLKARPQAKTPAAPATPASKPRYQAAGPDMGRPAAARQVGVTIWRLRRAASGEPGARILVQQEAGSEELVPERVSSTSSLKPADRVRLTVESPETGYLYVIDREGYAAGARGEPYLIFPTSRTRDGDNHVAAGKLIDIPAQDDRPNFFTLQQSRPDQMEEELTLLLTREPLPDVHIGRNAQKLTNEQVANWEKQWGTGKAQRFELSGGAGKPWTQAEQEAAAGATRILTQQDPAPQTVYRVAAKPGEPVMVKVRIRYSAAAPK